MADIRYLDDDIIRLYEFGVTPKRLIATLFWGDSVRVIGEESGQIKVELQRRVWNQGANRYETVNLIGALPKKTRFRGAPVLKVRFVDVGQGDGAIIETPDGKLILVDGGEEEHVRRYINVAYSHILRTRPVRCAAILITHGDADHFSGLTKLVEGFRSRTSPLITADRVFHNGLVKQSYERDTEAFGQTVKLDGVTYATELEDDLLQVPETRMNTPFRAWKKALQQLKERNANLVIERLEYGRDDAFAFLQDEGINIKVLGPITEQVNGKAALRFLRTPGSRSLSASHTVNGHSIVFKLTYGNVRFLFGADLNEESEEGLLARTRADNISLASEILKVPHHGSADFSPRTLEAIRPVVSVVSSGDENESKEYIHPRAGLVGALGKYSRATVDKPLIYVTEMVAFFKRLGLIETERLGQINNAYQKTQFGIVHVRTNAERVLVATHSGKDDQKESYAFRVDERGEVTFEEKTNII